jgi:hypothetical protein
MCLQIMDQANTILHFCGTLQQRAPPQVSILDEHVKPVEQDDEWQKVTDMPKTLRSQMDEIQELLDKLPKPRDHVRPTLTMLWLMSTSALQQPRRACASCSEGDVQVIGTRLSCTQEACHNGKQCCKATIKSLPVTSKNVLLAFTEL